MAAQQKFLVAQASRLCCEQTVFSHTGETPVPRMPVILMPVPRMPVILMPVPRMPVLLAPVLLTLVLLMPVPLTLGF